MLSENLTLKSTVETGGNSDHGPISLLVIPLDKKPPTPFKFNPLWLEDEWYRVQIQNSWHPIRRALNHTAMQQFADNLSREKKVSKE